MSRIKKLLRMLLQYPLRLFNKISLRATVVDAEVDKTTAIPATSDNVMASIDPPIVPSAITTIPIIANIRHTTADLFNAVFFIPNKPNWSITIEMTVCPTKPKAIILVILM